MLLLFALLAGCAPTCEEVCVKLVDDCGDLGTERGTADECQSVCEEQKALLSRWTDTQKQDAFDEELRCLQSSSCDDIADGVCYDDTVWSF